MNEASGNLNYLKDEDRYLLVSQFRTFGGLLEGNRIWSGFSQLR